METIDMKSIDFTLGDAAAVARDTCINSHIIGSVHTCRILLDALKKFGRENVRPLSVQVLVFNPFITKEFKPGKKSPSKKRLNYLLSHKNGYSVAIGGEGVTGSGWKGHLVLIANNSEGTWLIDPTLNMGNRSEHNITLLPLAVKVDENFGQIDGSRFVFNLNNCAVMYSGFPSDTSYESLTDWDDSHSNSVVANQIFERLSFGS